MSSTHHNAAHNPPTPAVQCRVHAVHKVQYTVCDDDKKYTLQSTQSAETTMQCSKTVYGVQYPLCNMQYRRHKTHGALSVSYRICNVQYGSTQSTTLKSLFPENLSPRTDNTVRKKPQKASRPRGTGLGCPPKRFRAARCSPKAPRAQPCARGRERSLVNQSPAGRATPDPQIQKPKFYLRKVRNKSEISLKTIQAQPVESLKQV